MSKTGPMLTIVGIVSDRRYTQLDAPAEPEVYVPYSRDTDGFFGFMALVLTKSDPLALAPSLRTLVSDIDNTQVPIDLMSLERALADSIAPRRLNLVLLSTFAVAALCLAMVGIYGVTAYSVAERAHEIGIRMALGAQQANVVGMVVRQGMRMTLYGSVVGVIAALTLTSLMESLLYEVRPTDPLTFAAVTAALVTTALLACCVPAFRAARIDPVASLRHE
jgi:putative ABC transport system permease protein